MSFLQTVPFAAVGVHLVPLTLSTIDAGIEFLSGPGHCHLSFSLDLSGGEVHSAVAEQHISLSYYKLLHLY